MDAPCGQLCQTCDMDLRRYNNTHGPLDLSAGEDAEDYDSPSTQGMFDHILDTSVRAEFIKVADKLPKTHLYILLENLSHNCLEVQRCLCPTTELGVPFIVPVLKWMSCEDSEWFRTSYNSHVLTKKRKVQLHNSLYEMVSEWLETNSISSDLSDELNYLFDSSCLIAGGNMVRIEYVAPSSSLEICISNQVVCIIKKGEVIFVHTGEHFGTADKTDGTNKKEILLNLQLYVYEYFSAF